MWGHSASATSSQSVTPNALVPFEETVVPKSAARQHQLEVVSESTGWRMPSRRQASEHKVGSEEAQPMWQTQSQVVAPDYSILTSNAQLFLLAGPVAAIRYKPHGCQAIHLHLLKQQNLPSVPLSPTEPHPELNTC